VHKIYKKLAWLNDLPADEAETVFRECSGHDGWARRMVDARPFATLDHLFNRADDARMAFFSEDGCSSAEETNSPTTPGGRELIEERLSGLLEH
jgi:hypothetical protein